MRGAGDIGRNLGISKNTVISGLKKLLPKVNPYFMPQADSIEIEVIGMAYQPLLFPERPTLGKYLINGFNPAPKNSCLIKRLNSCVEAVVSKGLNSVPMVLAEMEVLGDCFALP